MPDRPSSGAYRALSEGRRRPPYTRPVIVSDAAPGFLSLGQGAARAAALRAAASDRIQRTILVFGPRGAGKGAFVEDLLALLFCADPDASRRPCNACRGCRDARARTHPDLVTGSPERWRAERSTGESIVAAARRWLLESAGAPVIAERRVVLVEGVDRANEQTQNALLKALEEPGPRQMFVLVADEPNRVLPTIRSRSQPLRIGPIAHDELVAFLIDRERLPADQADALARISGGLIGRAIGYVRNPATVEWRRRTQSELLALLGHGRADRFASARELLDEAARIVASAPEDADEPPEDEAPRIPASTQRAAALAVIEAWLALARDLLVSASRRPQLAPAAQLLPDLEAVAQRIGVPALVVFVALLERVVDGLIQNTAPRLAIEVAMLAWPSVDQPAPSAAGGR